MIPILYLLLNEKVGGGVRLTGMCVYLSTFPNALTHPDLALIFSVSVSGPSSSLIFLRIFSEAMLLEPGGPLSSACSWISTIFSGSKRK